MRDRTFLAAITVAVLACVGLLCTPFLGRDGRYAVPSAVERLELPPVHVTTSTGVRPLADALHGPGVLLLVQNDSRSRNLVGAWEAELRRLRADPRTLAVLDPQLFVVQAGGCRPLSQGGLHVMCIESFADRRPERLPVRFIIGPGGEVRGVAYRESNFGVPSFAATARRLWGIARSRAQYHLINDIRRR